METQTVNNVVRPLDGGDINDILDGLDRNRNADWVFLESLFGPIAGRHTGVDDEAVAAAGVMQSHRRMIMADILAGSVSVRALVERQHERRMAKGRRIVAILKETSVLVTQQHLIMSDEGETTVHESKDNRTVDSELGDGKSLGLEDDSPHLSIEKDKEQEAKIEDSSTTKTANADMLEQDTVSSKECESVLIGERSDPLGLRDSTSLHSALPAPQSADCSTSKPDTIGVNNDDLYSFQEDDKYSALCIPCTTKDNVEAASGEESQLLPPTCAICLSAYRPKCYVSWSPTEECRHAFHRDCILTWLLKQDQPLCPCCRRPFIPLDYLDGSEGHGPASIEGPQQQPATDPRASLSLIQRHFVGAPSLRT